MNRHDVGGVVFVALLLLTFAATATDLGTRLLIRAHERRGGPGGAPVGLLRLRKVSRIVAPLSLLLAGALLAWLGHG